MFSIFKSKFYLKEILPDGYIDIHNHILAGIDDGAKTPEETNYLIAQMKALNIKAAFATPHTFNGLWNNTSESIRQAYEIALKNDDNRMFLKGYASEYMLDNTLIEKSREEKLLGLSKNFILIEFNLFNNPLNLYEMLFELKTKNYKVIIAHPERYLYFHNSIGKYQKLKEYGVFFQLNLLSLTGYYGKSIQRQAIELFKNDLYDFTGSDIHSATEITQFKTVPLQIPDKKKMDRLLENNTIFL
ncbi:tyrosine-protein phosphatase [Flavobacterium sp. NPDC079362]|uniref:tyrosine-protein phosphatase n=1 Tax=Flavobacterium sp. NPDC079362 TaxID=3390566 RepID=UPI003D053213